MKKYSRFVISKARFALVLLLALAIVLPCAVCAVGCSPRQSGGDDENGESITEEVDFSDMKYAALGDSITFGVDGFNGYQTQMTSPYCKVVGELLGFKEVYNHGVSSSCISLVLGERDAFCNRYSQMPDDADVISVMGGINDFGANAPIGSIDDSDGYTFCGALNVLAQGLKQKYPRAFIFFMTPLKWKAKTNGFEEICGAVKDVCAKYRIPVLDAANKADFSVEYNADGYVGDGLHPSQNFHTTVIAPLIGQFIKDNFAAVENN